MEALRDPGVGFILTNFAAGDLLGHTGDMTKAKQAAACVDRALSHVVAVAQECNVTVLISADHGNLEVMLKGGKAHTGHTSNPVPFIAINKELQLSRNTGELCDIAPTVLKLLNIACPHNMIGVSIL